MKKKVVKKAAKKVAPKKTSAKKEKKETVAQEALRLLSKVPAAKWTSNEYTDNNGKCCALGHMARLKSKNPKDFTYMNCANEPSGGAPLRKITRSFLKEKYKIVSDIVDVNDRETINGYNQKTPKARVVAVLKDMIKAGL